VNFFIDLPEDKNKPKKIEPNASYREMYNQGKEVYDAGKSVYKFIKNRKTNFTKPIDFEEVLERASRLEEDEKNAKLYYDAKAKIEEFEQRQYEYEATLPKKSWLQRLRGK